MHRSLESNCQIYGYLDGKCDSQPEVLLVVVPLEPLVLFELLVPLVPLVLLLPFVPFIGTVPLPVLFEPFVPFELFVPLVPLVLLVDPLLPLSLVHLQPHPASLAPHPTVC